jgi:pimeloyl-ACP methyl ester carboxylesterase
VPVDYGSPEGEQLELALHRARASEGQSRSPLFYLPGGPGVPVIHFAEAIRSSIGARLPDLDLVLMDPRGVRQSAPIDCMGPSFLDHGSPLNVSIGADDDVEEKVEELAEFWRQFEQECRDAHGEHALSSYHSQNVARDLEQVRKALGAPELNLWAASYAAIDAAIYAKLFPRNVGAFLLGLPAFRGNADRIQDVTASLASHDTELQRALSWCAEGNRCGLGNDVDAVFEAYDALRRELHGGMTFRGKRVVPESLTLAMVLWLGEGQRAPMAHALTEAAAGDWSRVVQRATTDPYFDDEVDQLAYWQASSVIQLLDFECPRDYSAERAAADVRRALERYPRTAEVFTPLFASCVGWSTRPREPRVVPENVAAPPMLLIAGAHDPQTPVAGARALRKQLNNDSQLLVVDTEGHDLASDSHATREAVRFFERNTE